MVHRDVQTRNIMLTSDGTPKLMDMGISKSMSENSQLTMTGFIVGTPHYMSPEQARGDDGLDFHTDIYALGATLYHMVAGIGAVRRDDHDAGADPADHGPAGVAGARRNPQVSEGCAALVEAMMAKDAKDRPHPGRM